MRVAALDIGTNTTRALIADVADGRVDEVVRRTAVTRLGEGLGRSRNLLPTAIARVRKALDEYMREVDRHGVERALLVATAQAAATAASGFETRASGHVAICRKRKERTWNRIRGMLGSSECSS